MAQLLGNVTEGTLVKLNESGSPVDFYVAKHDYESSLNGAGRTLVVRKDTYDDRVWDSGNVNAYASSDLDSWFNSTYKNMLDADIRSLIGTTKIRYTPGNGNNTVGTLERAIFALSLTELGQSHSYANTEGSALPIASTLRIAYRNGSATTQWTRSPNTNVTNVAWRLNSDGNIYYNNCSSSFGSRPAFTLPSSLYVSDDGTVFQNTAPPAPASITVPSFAVQGGSVSISWPAVTDPDGNLAGYRLQRSVNGGTWTQVYQGAGTSFSDTAPASATTLQYRVQAYDDLGLSSGWKTSGSVPVYGSPSITVPPLVMQGQPLTVSWSEVDVADSYILQRLSSADTDWTQVYSGADTEYTETAGTWTSLQYRVCAVFGSSNGPWATSGAIQIVAASALVISGADGDLGTLVNDVEYSISSDQTSPAITATVEVNGGEYASFAATSGETYHISVLDLPTGTGSIVITASTTVSSSPVTVTRTWSYTKTAQSFPNAGSVAQLTQEGETIWPHTLAEAVRTTGGPWGGDLSKALNLLQGAAVYNRASVPKYAEVSIDLSTAQAGDIVNLPENGVMVPFYVASLDYEPTLNTSGTRVLLVRKDVYQNGPWNSTNVNTYANSTIDTWFNSTYLPMLDSTVQGQVGTTTFQYTPGNGNNTVTTLSRAVFALSMAELGSTGSIYNSEGTELPIYSILCATPPGFNQLTRTPTTNSTSQCFGMTYGGETTPNCNTTSLYYRPCFTLPVTFQATYYVDPNSGAVYPSQEYTTAGDFADLWGNIIPTVKIETGSYTGTGTYGSGNPNTLTFASGNPAALVIVPVDGASGGYVWLNGCNQGSTAIVSGVTTTAIITWTENAVAWYSTTGASPQLNDNGYTFNYFAIFV